MPWSAGDDDVAIPGEAKFGESGADGGERGRSVAAGYQRQQAVTLVALGCRRDRATSTQQGLVARREQRRNRGRGGGNEIVLWGDVCRRGAGRRRSASDTVGAAALRGWLAPAFGQGLRLPPR
jgi:hypothetical protein